MTDPESSVEVTGRIVLPKAASRRRRAAAVVVQVEDTSRMDVGSTVVAEQRRTDVDLAKAGTDLPFSVAVPAGLIDRRASYNVRVHVDTSGNGEVTEGDYISTASHPVLTHGYPNEAVVPVIEV